MTWARMDDAMGEHRKTRRLLKAGGLDAFGLHSLAILNCARYLTDGFVEEEFVEETLDAAKVRGKARDRITDKLEEIGQWIACPGGWMIHDYLDHNPSRADVEARRAADAERKARGRGSESRRSPQGVRPDSARTDAGVREESARPDPALPVPTRPDPSLSEPSRPDVDKVCHLLADLIQRNDPKAKVDPASKRWRDAARLLIDNDRRTVDEIEQVIRWCQADQFWQSNVLSMPKLREKFQQLALRMRTEQLPVSRQGAGPTAEDFLAAGGGNP